jgi:hypothetical protein
MAANKIIEFPSRESHPRKRQEEERTLSEATSKRSSYMERQYQDYEDDYPSKRDGYTTAPRDGYNTAPRDSYRQRSASPREDGRWRSTSPRDHYPRTSGASRPRSEWPHLRGAPYEARRPWAMTRIQRPSQRARREGVRSNFTHRNTVTIYTLKEWMEEDMRPPTHPRNREIEQMKAGEYRETASCTYFKTGDEEKKFIVLGKSRHSTDSQHSGQDFRLDGPVAFVANLQDPAGRKIPYHNLDAKLLLQDRLFTRPRVTKIEDDGHYSCDCPPTSAEIQMEYVTPSVCVRSHYVNKKEMCLYEAKSVVRTWQANPNKTYQASKRPFQPVLMCPQPFLNNIGWAGKAYSPAMAGLDAYSRNKAALFYRLHDSDRYRQQCLPWMKHPSTWSRKEHPWCGEPSGTDELALWAKGTYGSETLFRVLYPAHPGAGPTIPVYTAESVENGVPVLRVQRDLMAFTKFLRDVLYPFYCQGRGSIMCPVCLLEEDDNEELRPVLLSRMAFLPHFETRHARNLHFSALGFSTGYGQRIHEAYCLYVLILAHLPGAQQEAEDTETDDRTAAVDLTALQLWNVEYVHYFKNLNPERTLEEASEDSVCPGYNSVEMEASGAAPPPQRNQEGRQPESDLLGVVLRDLADMES